MASAPGSESKNWPLWILLLMAVGGPVAAGLTFAEQITQHPWKALGIAVLYELVVLVAGFVGKVWERLEPRLADKVADCVSARVQELFWRYRRRYLQHLVYRHRDFDVKGLTTQGTFTLELERVFVELTVAPQPAHRASTAPVRAVPEELRKGRHVIWDYLRSEPLVEQNLAVIGPPGCGKTTLLKHMALTLTARRKERTRVNAPDKLPVLLFLRDHGKAIQENPELSLAQAVRDDLAKRRGPEAPRGWFARQLERGRCLVMLDGLDEVADPEARKRVAAWVEREMTAWGKNRFVVSSRPHGYRSNPLGKVTVLEVMPFTIGQVERFVQNWYMANEIMSAQKDDPGVRLKAREGAEDLLRRIRNTASLSALAVNPLLLTMIANVHRFRSSLPGRRVELYAEICEVFLGKRQEAKGLAADLTPAQKRRVLQPLAYGMMCGRKREIKADEAVEAIRGALARVSPGTWGEAFLETIENTSGVLVERESGVYSFAHLTFQEYLAAVHVQEKRDERALAKRVGDSWWHETIRLYGAQADATEIIQACLVGEPPSVAALTLAIECLAEAREVRPEVRVQLESVLDKGIEDPDLERRHIVAEALLSLRPHRMVRISEDTYMDPTLVTHAEYQLFLDEQRAQGTYLQPDHWPTVRFPQGAGRKPVTGVRPSDVVRFCEWLAEREVDLWQYRVPLVEEVEMEATRGGPQGRWPANVGYWCTSGRKGEWTTCGSPKPELPPFLLRRQIEDDLDLEHILSPTRDRALDNALCSAFVRAFHLGLDLALAYALALALARVIGRAIALDLAVEHVLGPDLERVLDRDRAFDIEHARNLARDLGHARDLTHAQDLAPARDFDHARARARDLDLALARARTLAPDFDRALAFDLVLARARAHTLAPDLNLALTRARARDLDLDLVCDPDLDLSRARDLARAFDLDLDRDVDRASFYTAVLACVLDRGPHIGLANSGESLDAARQYVRVLSLLFAVHLHLLTLESTFRDERSSLEKDSAAFKDEIQRLVGKYIDVYMNLAILEARIRGRVPTFEGIRIVRERKGNDK